MLGAIAAILIVALAAPQAFGHDALLFAIAYGVARTLHIVLSAIATRRNTALRRDTIRLVPNAVIATALLVAAALLNGTAQLGCWVALAAVSYLGVLLGGGRGWQVSPRHFVERFGQIILIALGESVVAIGLGAQGHQLDTSLIAAVLLGITVIASLWWAYFDWVVYVAQARLAAAPPIERARLARDAYACLHSVMVAGIILFAFGLETALHQPRAALELVTATALAGGVALYLIAHIALRLRLGGGIGRGRPIAALLLLASIPLYTVAAAIAALAVTAAICVALIAYEIIRHREPRALIRARRGTLEAADIVPLPRAE
jgi:low temperature requirement protein LtrA